MENTVFITSARHAWPEKDGFTINRPRGLKQYTFLHFWGSVELLVDGKVVTTQPDSCILYDTNTPQWFRSIGPLRHDWIHMTGDISGCLEAAGLKLDTVYVPGNGKFITAITREIEQEVLNRRQESGILTELKLRELLLKIARGSRAPADAQLLREGLVAQLRQVRMQVFSELEKPWTVADMAQLAWLSPSRFHTVYRQLFAISPMDDLIRARIDTAKNRLLSGQESVQSLAEALGYRNVTHFCRQFKQLTGLRPGKFRETR